MVEYTEFLTATNTLSTTPAFVETIINTPTPRLGGGYGGRYGGRTATCMVIHKVEFEIAPDADMFSTTLYGFDLQLTKQSKSDIIGSLNDNDLIAMWDWHTMGTVAQGMMALDQPKVITFSPPLLVPQQKLYFGSKGKNAGVTSVATIRIHYTMRDVAESDIVRANIV